MHRWASSIRIHGMLGLIITYVVMWCFGCGTGGIQGSDGNNDSTNYEMSGDNSPSGARDMTSGIAQQGYIEYTGDSDWFRIDPNLDPEINIFTLRVELSNQVMSSAVDLSVTVYGDVDSEVDNNDLTIIGGHYDSYGGDGMTQITLELTVEEYEVCYIVIRDHLGNESDPINPYFVTGTIFSGPGDGNNSPDTATLLECGIETQDAIQTLMDMDWFQLDFTADILALTLDMPAGSPDLTATLYESTATTALASLQDADGSNGPTALSRNIRLTQAGTYYLAIRDSLDDDYDAGLEYTLLTQCIPDPDTNESNNTLAEAAVLDGAAPLMATGYIAFQEDEDWYRFNMPYNGLLNFTFETSAAGIALEFLCTIADSDGDSEAEFIIEGGSVPADFSARIALDAGLHYLRIMDQDDDEADLNNSYSIHIDFEPDPDLNEPNGNYPTRQENMNNATSLIAGIPEVGYIGSNSDQDWFQIFLNPGVYNFSLTNTAASDVDLSVSLYQTDGVTRIMTRQEEDRTGGEGPSSITAQHYIYTTGSYYLLVQDYGNNDTDLDLPYQIEVNSIPLPTLPEGSLEEPNENYSEYRLITSGQEVEGYIEFEGDRDWYGLEFTEEQDVVVEIWNEANSPIELVWFMYRPESTIVFASDGDTDDDDESPVHITTGGPGETFWVGEEYFGTFLFKISDYNRDDWDTAVPYHFMVTLSPHTD